MYWSPSIIPDKVQTSTHYIAFIFTIPIKRAPLYNSHLALPKGRQVIFNITFIVPDAVTSQDVNRMSISDGTIQYQITLVSI